MQSAAIRGSPTSCGARGSRCEPEEIPDRAQAAQRLQDCDRLRCRRVIAHVDRESALVAQGPTLKRA